IARSPKPCILASITEKLSVRSGVCCVMSFHTSLPMRVILCLLVLVAATKVQAGEPTTDVSALARLPVKEVTIFKDGHCLALHSGSMPVNDDGNVVLDYLPTPVLGTFWPFSADKDVKLSSTISGERLVNIERTALTLR